MSLRVLLVHPGASIATHDVFVGLHAGLLEQGCEVSEYALDGRIERAGQWLNYCWKKGGKTVDRPSQADTLYKAGAELIERALRLEPDVVLIVSAMFLHPDVVVLLKRAGLKTAVLFTESPYDDERQVRLLPFLNLAWTNERTSARIFAGLTQTPVHYLPHAFNPAVHQAKAVDPSVPAHDVVFVGTGFQERVDLFSQVDWTGIDLGLYGSWDLVGSRSRLRPSIKGGYIDNAKTAALYQRATIGLNLYRQSKGFGKHAPKIRVAESLNPRAYELAAMGCFTLSDARAEVAEVFGSSVPMFQHAAELRPLIDRWLADEVGRRRIQAHLPTCVAGHTWLDRARRMVRHLRDAGIVARCGSTEPVQEPAVAGG